MVAGVLHRVEVVVRNLEVRMGEGGSDGMVEEVVGDQEGVEDQVVAWMTGVEVARTLAVVAVVSRSSEVLAVALVMVLVVAAAPLELDPALWVARPRTVDEDGLRVIAGFGRRVTSQQQIRAFRP